MANKEVGQEFSRVDTVMYDPHGRPWHAILERKTMTPTGPISPLFKAPFYPDQKYLRPGGQRNPLRLGIDYEAMDLDLQEAHREREIRIRRIVAKSVPQSQVAKTLKNPPEEILFAVDGDGEGPMPVEVAWACMQGNRWVLGYSENEPAWVRDSAPLNNFFHPPLKEFARRRAEMLFPDAEEDNDETQALIPLTDEEIAPTDPSLTRSMLGQGAGTGLQGLDGGEAGLPGAREGDHASWGNPDVDAPPPVQTSVRSPLRRE